MRDGQGYVTLLLLVAATVYVGYSFVVDGIGDSPLVILAVGIMLLWILALIGWFKGKNEGAPAKDV
ncbi:MAG: hypothetical protein GF416_02985 [Candidatus Altiarchaeales archaeon]|nr:hypothetical protein [Candidatus Altiarchaeales archaeon]